MIAGLGKVVYVPTPGTVQITKVQCAASVKQKLFVTGSFCLSLCQAAELVTANLSSYQSHMLIIKAYLEERLQVSVSCNRDDLVLITFTLTFSAHDINLSSVPFYRSHLKKR